MAQSNEKYLSKYKAQVSSLENKVEEQNVKIEKTDALSIRIESLMAEQLAWEREKDALTVERDEMKRYASELVEKVKNEVVGKENLIDKRMINTFLV